MIKKSLILIFLFLTILLMPKATLANEANTIIIIVDELSFKNVEELSLKDYTLGFVNLKTRAPYSEEQLYLSINMGRKLNLSDFGKEDMGIEYLGDILKEEKTSFIGQGKEILIIGDKNRNVDYKEDTMVYNLESLIKKTNNLLEKSNILGLSYDLQNDLNRVETLSAYLDHYKSNKIIILPKNVAKEDNELLNKYIVPIIYIDNQNKGLLTSLSTKREGFISIEDISVHIKNIYSYNRKTNIGKEFQFISNTEPLKENKKLYSKTMNLLIIAYIFHGLTYLMQFLLGIWILRQYKFKRWLYILYISVSTIICSSLILGVFEFHANIFLYLAVIIPLNYIIIRTLSNKRYNLIKYISISTYSLIVFGITLYPKMIYNSYIGFNNLVYGARYYGLNNGIMGVLLSTSILIFFSTTKDIKNINIKRFIGFFIFGLNIIVLSARFGANTGGFITSIALFGIMMYMNLSDKKPNLKNIGIMILIGVVIFSINMIFDNINQEKSHAIQFFYRLKENGIKELISMIRFKATELIKLTLTPPFSIVIIFQAIILNKIWRYFKEDNEIKKEAIAIIATAFIGFILNDTGVITFIYMIQYLIFATITRRFLNE